MSEVKGEGGVLMFGISQLLDHCPHISKRKVRTLGGKNVFQLVIITETDHFFQRREHDREGHGSSTGV